MLDRSSFAKKQFLRLVAELDPGQLRPYQPKHAYQLICKFISVQKFSTLVLKFKDFLKNTFK